MSISPRIKEISSIADGFSEGLMRLKKDKLYRPTQEDIRELQFISEKLFHAHALAGYVERCMHQRMNGEAEGAKKFTDSEVFDYHYPA